MKRKVSLVEINVYDGMVPLVSGYLQAYACKDPELDEAYTFDKYVRTTKILAEEVIQELASKNSDVYAFSCYLWNMELMKAIYLPLMDLRPEATYILGGPQVMHHAHEYLDVSKENLLLCNGEGEITFSNFLRELLNEVPDLEKIKGISFSRNGEIVTTQAQERVKELDDVPSPFLTGVFDGKYHMSIIESNRGCPFRCAFCFWGAATNDRVFKFSEDRVMKELTWISENKVPFIFIADANWGMLKRDIVFSEHIAQCKVDKGVPVYVYFSAAKNSPGRVAEITEIFTDAGLINAQPISMQSLHDRSLELIDRKNIKLSAFAELQEDLNDREISSFIELIWPLPGETLQTFKDGIQELYDKRASIIVVYPHLLLHNTPLYKRQEEFGIITKKVFDNASEADLVIATAEAPYEDFETGMWFYYFVLALYNARGMHSLSRYLHSTGKRKLGDLYSDLIEFARKREDDPFSKFCQDSLDETLYYDITNYPLVYHMTMHTHRREFEKLLYDFCSAQFWWSDENARVLFEVDMLTKPFIYSNTQIEKPNCPIEHINILDIEGRSYVVEIGERFTHLIDLKLPDSIKTSGDGTEVFKLDHKRVQYPFRDSQTQRDNADYCYGMIMRVSKILPLWTQARLEEV